MPVTLRSRLFAAAMLSAATNLAAQILPPPPVPAGNPLTPDKVLLGKALFWDEQLSSSRTVACGTCHIPSHGGSDPRTDGAVHPGFDGLFRTPDDIRGSLGVVRHDPQGRFLRDGNFGIRPQVTSRRAPSTINAAYAVDLFWDGRASRVFRDPVTNAVVLPGGGALESQIAGPPTSDVEMSHIGRTWTDIATDLAQRTPLALADRLPTPLANFVQGHTYASLFQQVFGSPGVTPVRIIFAIASYERTLVSDQSPFDRSLVNQHTLSPQETRGLVKFRGLCASCHVDVEPSVLVTGPVLNDYRNAGVRPAIEDPGRANVTGNLQDRGLFRVPGMRNVALRAPYFHNGSRDTLLAVVEFYARGGQFTTDPLIINIPGQLSTQDKLDIVAFLQSMTDPRVAGELPPFDRPRLWSESASVPTVFGVGTAGSGGFVPGSVATLPAYSGNPAFTLAVDRVLGGSPQVLLLSNQANAAPTSILGLNIYLDLSSPPITIALPQPAAGSGPGDGIAQITLPIPGRVAGAVLFGQWLSIDAQAPFGMTISDAFRVPFF